jgi:ferritin-like metal-binding protein YciE
MNPQDRLIAWLKDAYTMEQNMIPVLESHARCAIEYHGLRDRLDQHIGETYRHREQVARCLRLLGAEPSLVKAMAATATGMMQGVATTLQRDAVLKDTVADYTTESMEIATYTALVAAARELGHEQIASICSDILDEEVEMAAWLEEHIPEITTRAVQGVEA